MLLQQEAPIVIELSKTKKLFMLVGCVGFVFASVFLWMNADSHTFKVFSPGVIRGIAVLGIAFFGVLIGSYSIYKLFDQKPGLMLDQEGIRDNSSAIGGQLIRWNDIKRVEEVKVMNNDFLLVYVQNPEGLMARENLFQRWLMQMNYKQYGTPVAISSTVLKCNFQELTQLIRTQLAKYNPHAEM